MALHETVAPAFRLDKPQTGQRAGMMRRIRPWLALRAARLLSHAVAVADRNPAIRQGALTWLGKFPLLKARLRRTLMATRQPAADLAPIEWRLSRHAQHIQDELVAALARRRKGHG
jgi:hypothetical protein